MTDSDHCRRADVPPDDVTLSGSTARYGDPSAFLDLPELAWVTSERRSAVAANSRLLQAYEPEGDELLWLAKLAWRNHARCAGRLSWEKLRLHDRRHCSSAEEVAQACWEHLRWSTNDGAIRPLITVFGPSQDDGGHRRIWNPQLIRFAGYEQRDGSIVGDPLHIELTRYVTKLGWRGAGTPFDVLPLVISKGDASDVQLFDVPDDCALQVEIVHPEFEWFADLGLRWHANPAVSNLSMIGAGLEFPCAPFSGWYHSSEIGARNLSDRHRYDMLPEIGRRMGLDQRSERTLWRDKALVELNVAVLHSYKRAGVHMVDHHAASAQFSRHVERERAAGRTVRADWSWINPPLSASLTPTFSMSFAPIQPGVWPDFVAQPGAVPTDLLRSMGRDRGYAECPVSEKVLPNV